MEEENDGLIVRSERYSLMEDEDWSTRGGNIWNQTPERSTTRVKASRCRATTCQLVQLVKFMEKHPELAVAHAKPFPGSDKLWMKLAEHINQFGPPKSFRQCKTTWRDLRKRALSMQRTRTKKGTGRNLYGMAPKIISLITQAGAPNYKDMDEEGEGSASSSKPDSPSPSLETPAPTTDDQNTKTEKTKGEQLVIRVTDKSDSTRNVFNRFTISDGHFENVIVKEEMSDQGPSWANQEEDNPEPTEEEELESQDQSEEMFPQPEAILGTMDEVMEEKNSVIKDLNDTLRKFLVEYKTRNALMRERIDLERARLQFDMEVYRSRQMEKRVIAVNAANAANVMNANAKNPGANVITVNAGINTGKASNANNITVGSTANVGNAGNVITANAGANTINVTNAVKPNPVITLNPMTTGNPGNGGISVKIENTASVRDANVASSANDETVMKNAIIAKAKNPVKVEDAAKVDAMDET